MFARACRLCTCLCPGCPGPEPTRVCITMITDR